MRQRACDDYNDAGDSKNVDVVVDIDVDRDISGAGFHVMGT